MRLPFEGTTRSTVRSIVIWATGSSVDRPSSSLAVANFARNPRILSRTRFPPDPFKPKEIGQSSGLGARTSKKSTTLPLLPRTSMRTVSIAASGESVGSCSTCWTTGALVSTTTKSWGRAEA